MARILLSLAGLLLAHLLSAQTITGFEYWFNQAHNQRVFVPGAGTWNNPAISDTNLAHGPQEVHMRLKDTYQGQSRWSSVVSRHFVNGPGGPYQIIAVRYWKSDLPSVFPADMRYKYFTTPVQFLNLTTDLDFCGWNSPPLLTVKFQLLDNHGYWSSVVTRSNINAVLANAPNAVTSITSPGPYCPGDQVVFTANHTVVPPNGTPTSFTWTVPNGNGWNAVPSTGNTITVTIGNAAGTLSVVANNYCGTSASTQLQVVPLQPSVLTGISGSATVCENDSATYTTQNFAGTYHWVAPQGWSFYPANPSGNTANAIPSSNAVSGPITVYVTNACGDNSNTVSILVSPAFLPGAVTAITWPTEACTGSQIALNVTPATAATGYEWTTPGGGTVSAGSPFFNFTVGTTDGTITANATNACGDGPVISMLFNALQVPNQPGAIVGPDSVCGNDNVQYSVPNDPDVDSYLWVYPDSASGWFWNDNSINVVYGTVLPGADDGFITVFATNQCDTSIGATPIQLTALDIPAAPGSISGPDSLCPGSIGNYVIAPVPEASGYVWDWPTGWNGTTGTTTNESATAGVVGGVLEVVATNQCGTSPASPLLLSVLPVAAVPVITGDFSICAGEQTTLSIQNYDLANDYTWSNQSTDSTITVGVGSYSVTADNGLCAASSSATAFVTEEDVTITLMNGNTSTGQSGLATVTVVPPPDAVTYQWTLPMGWAWDPIDTNTTDPTANLVAPQDTGSYLICVTAISANGCTDDSCWVIQVDLNVGVEEPSAMGLFNVYPNPSSGVFMINAPLQIGKMELVVHDATGKQVRSESREAGSTTLDLTALASGCYRLTVKNDLGEWRTRLVIQH